MWEPKSRPDPGLDYEMGDEMSKSPARYHSERLGHKSVSVISLALV